MPNVIEGFIAVWQPMATKYFGKAPKNNRRLFLLLGNQNDKWI
jgi:hypothetical protein